MCIYNTIGWMLRINSVIIVTHNYLFNYIADLYQLNLYNTKIWCSTTTNIFKIWGSYFQIWNYITVLGLFWHMAIYIVILKCVNK